MKLKKIKTNPAHWPPEDQVNEIRKKLSSLTVMGTTILGKDASTAEKFKWDLCSKIVRYKIENGVSQKQMAKILEIDPPEANRLLHYKIERYTIDRLVKYVEILYPKLKLKAIA